MEDKSMAVDLEKYIASVRDFPKEGILFRDVTPVLQHPEAFRECIDRFCEYAKKVNANVIVGPESRGFIFGAPVALELGISFAPARKPGKLPRETRSVSYDLEYGSAEIHLHTDAVKPGDRVLIIDDLLATGGTARATAQLVEELGGTVAGVAFVIELYGNGMNGRGVLDGYDVFTLLKMSDQ
jgi:adenine phosphoribosyltransferase